MSKPIKFLSIQILLAVSFLSLLAVGNARAATFSIDSTSFEEDPPTEEIPFTLTGSGLIWGISANQPRNGSNSLTARNVPAGTCTFNDVTVSGYSDVMVSFWIRAANTNYEDSDFAKAYISEDGGALVKFMDVSGITLQGLTSYTMFTGGVADGTDYVTIYYEVSTDANQEYVYADDFDVTGAKMTPTPVPTLTPAGNTPTPTVTPTTTPSATPSPVPTASPIPTLTPGATPSQRYMRVFYLNWTDYGSTGMYGDATYMEFPGVDGILDTADDRNLLFDGGWDNSPPNALSEFLDDKLAGFPYYNTIYYMVLSSPGADHYTGLRTAVDRYNVVNYFENDRWPEGGIPNYDLLIEALDAEGTNVYYFDAEDYLSGPSTTVGPGWDPNIEAKVLVARDDPMSGSDDNSWAPIILIENGESGFLFGGDSNGVSPYAWQEVWIQSPGSYPGYTYDGAWNELTHADFYKVHHHGSANASGATFMNRMAPRYAVVEVGHSSGGHPYDDALGRIHDAGAIQYRTDLDHHVEVRCDDQDNYEVTRWMAWSPQTNIPIGSGDYASGDLNCAPPDLVTGLTLDAATKDYVVLSWDNASYDFNVYRSTTANGAGGAGRATQPGLSEATGIYEKLTASPISFNTYTDNSFSCGQAYYYRIASLVTNTELGFSQTLERRWSNEVSAFLLCVSPTPTPVGYKTVTPTPSVPPTATPTLTPPGYSSPTPEPTSAAPTTGKVLLTEVHMRGSNSPITYEWVEIQNMSGGLLNLKNWAIDDLEAGGPYTLVTDNATLADGEIALIHFAVGTSDSDTLGRDNSGFATVFDFYTGTGNELSDDKDTVALFNSSSEYVDAVVYHDGTTVWAGSNEENDCKELVDAGQWSPDTDESSTFEMGTGSVSYSIYRTSDTDTDTNDDWALIPGNDMDPGWDNTGYAPIEVLITEVHQSTGASAQGGVEWVEIQNVSGFDINIDGWQIDDLDTDNRHTFASGLTTLLDGECALIHISDGVPWSENDASSRAASGFASVWDFYVDDSAVLADTQDQVVLRFNPSSNIIVDAVTYWDGDAVADDSLDRQVLVAAGEWSPDSSNDSVVNLNTTSTTAAFWRQTSADTDTKADWTVGLAEELTPGLDNIGYKPVRFLITEADPRGLHPAIGHDWFEIQNISGFPVNINEWRFNDRDASFYLSTSDLTLPDGRVAVVHLASTAGVSENDATGWSYSSSAGAQNEVWDIYLDGAGSALYSPQDEIVLLSFMGGYYSGYTGSAYDAAGAFDAVAYWASGTGAFADVAELVEWGQWSPDSDSGNMVNYGADTFGFRRTDSTDNDDKTDWTVYTATLLDPGLDNIGYFQGTPTPAGYKTPTPIPTPSPSVTPTPTPPTPTPSLTPTPTPVPPWGLLTTLSATGPVVSVYADGDYVYAKTTDSHLRVWSYDSWALVTDLTSPPGSGAGEVYVDDTYIYTGDADANLDRWDLTDFSFGEEAASGEGAVNGVFGDGSSYVFAATGGGYVKRYDRADFTTATRLYSPSAGSANNDVFVDDDYVYAASAAKTLQVWDASTLNFTADFSPQSASNWAEESDSMLAVHADADYIYAGSANNNLYVFNRATRDYVTRKDFASGDVNSVWAVQSYFYGASSDNDVYVYTRGYWNLLTALAGGTDVMWDVYADLDYIFGACNDNKVYIWVAPITPAPTPTPTQTPDTTPTTTPAAYNQVIFNEVAWMGTSASSYDEWIEIYNTSGSNIDVSGWYIMDNGGLLTTLSGTFAKDSYYLLEKADDNTVSDIAADQIWTTSGTLSNTGESLSLFNASSELVDHLDCTSGWYAGESTGRYTMERIYGLADSNDPDNWQDWQGPQQAGQDANGELLNATARALNSTGGPGYSPTPTAKVPTITPTPADYTTPTVTPTPDGWQSPTPTPSPEAYYDVVFNELAWAGTSYSAYDEWIELYAVNASSLNLNGWSITAANGNPTFTINTDLVVNTGDYILLEYNDDSTVSDLSADFVYPYGAYRMEDGGEDLSLKNASGDLIDRINMSTYWWGGSEAPYYYTMERVRPDWPSDEHFTWATWNGTTWRGLDAGGSPLSGTADELNSVYSASAPTPIPTPTPSNYGGVVFNEVAWMGTKASTAHEWFELRNNTGSAVNLYNFRVYTKSGNVDFTITTDLSIASLGYQIFERVTDYAVRDVSGYVYSSGYLSNEGEWLILADSNGIIWDDLDYNPINWPAGTQDPDYATMEKIDPELSGNESWNWEDNDGVDINGHDADDNEIDGTPGGENSDYNPTSVELVDFLALGYDGVIAVEWETGAEIDNFGFIVHRAESERGEFRRVSEFILASGSPSGGRYLFPDRSVENGVIYYYKLQAIDTAGVSKWYGPKAGMATESAGDLVYDPADYAEIGKSYTAPTPTPTLTPTPNPLPTPHPPLPILDRGDYDGDGVSDIAIFRPATGLWAVQGQTRFYFGASGDIPAPGDYGGGVASDVAIFRPATGLWAVRGFSRFYFGAGGDIPVPADYLGNSWTDPAIFRPATGLWTVRGWIRAYFGREGDLPVPGDYDGDGTAEFVIFRPESGLWAVAGLTRLYFGASGDIPVPGDYSGDGSTDPAVFRPSTGLWAVRDWSRFYFGRSGDLPVPLDGRGEWQHLPTIFRRSSGLWAIRGLTRVYFGSKRDLPATR